MKKFVVLNKTAEDKYALLTGDQAFLDQGPEGTFFSDNTQKFGGTRQVISQEAFKAPTKLVKSGEMAPVDMEGQFVVEINGVAVPFIFNAEDLPDYFNDGDGNTTGLVFELSEEEWLAGDWATIAQAFGTTGNILRAQTTDAGWGIKEIGKDDLNPGEYEYINNLALAKVTIPKFPIGNIFSSKTGKVVWLASSKLDGQFATANTLYNVVDDTPIGLDFTVNKAERVVFFGANEDMVGVMDDSKVVRIGKNVSGFFTQTDGYTPDLDWVSGLSVTPDGKALVVLANTPLQNTRQIALDVLAVDANGLLENNRAPYVVSGDLVGYESPFGGGAFDMDPIYASDTKVIIPLDGQLLACVIDHTAKTVTTSFLPLSNLSNVTLLRKTSEGVVELFCMGANFTYTVQRYNADTEVLTQLKASTPIGADLLSGYGGTVQLEEGILLLNTYASGAPGEGVFYTPKVAVFDVSNNITFAKINDPAPQA